MRLSLVSAIAVLLAVCTTAQTNAQSCRSCQCRNTPTLHAFHAGYHANVDWPAQYVPTARRSVLSAYDVMVNNGWRRQNLLGTYHFDPDTNELTEAGKLKVNWILTQTPQHRRNIFVQRAVNESQTASRVDSINRWASNMSPGVGPLDINDTHIVAEGHPAATVDHIFVGFQTNQPPPVLPADDGSSNE